MTEPRNPAPPDDSAFGVLRIKAGPGRAAVLCGLPHWCVTLWSGTRWPEQRLCGRIFCRP